MAVAKPLAESLRHEVVCAEHDIAGLVPDPPGTPIGVNKALSLALRRVQDAQVSTRWSSAAVPGAPSDPLPTDPDWAGGSLYTDRRRPWSRRARPSCGGWSRASEARTAGTPSRWPGRCAGCSTGWPHGVGLRRGRRDATRLRVGDSLDFWRVEEIEPGRLLRLRAEMRLPGLAWLEMSVDRDPGGRTRYRQRALFHPRGLLGHAYWWAVSPSTPPSSAA